MTIHLNRSASRLVERELLPFLRALADDGSAWVEDEAARMIKLFTPPKPSSKKQQARKKKKLAASGDREAHRLETARIRAAALERADGRCECCGEPFGAAPDWQPELDHFYGRGKEPQTRENCWMLAKICHQDKTENRPNRAEWDTRFRWHCQRHGYAFRPRLVKSAALSNPDRVRSAEGEKDLP